VTVRQGPDELCLDPAAGVTFEEMTHLGYTGEGTNIGLRVSRSNATLAR
jgi:hypothetical protein